MSGSGLMDEFDFSVFPPPEREHPCQLYLISPEEMGGDFPDRLSFAGLALLLGSGLASLVVPDRQGEVASPRG